MNKLFFLLFLMCGVALSAFAQNDNELTQARTWLQEKKYNEAIGLLEKITTQAPNLLAAYYLKGLAYLQTNNADQAINAFNIALRKDPAHSGLYFYRALAQEAKGDDIAALKDLETAILLRSDNPQYFYRAAKIQTKLKQYSEAKMNYQQAMALAPDNAQILEDRDKSLAQMPADIRDNNFVSRSRGVKDATTVNIETQIKQATFAALSDGKVIFNQINAAKTSAENKKTLLAQLRTKVMKDVYANKELFREDIEDLQFAVQSESWLLPEAMNFVFDLTANSPNWFSEIIDCGNGVRYRYQVNKGREDKDYNIDIYLIKNDETHNIYNSNLRLSTDANTGESLADIFLMQNRGYVWKIMSGSYLRGTFREGAITYSEVGKMAMMKTDLLADCLAKNPQLVQPQDASQVAALKALVQNLILNYSLQFDKVD